jgi:hypothetical protein
MKGNWYFGFLWGVFVGATLGTALIGWGIWESALATGEAIAWRKVPEATRICMEMMQRGGLNDIQEGECARLLAEALGEAERKQ